MLLNQSLTTLAADLRNGRLSLHDYIDQLEDHFNRREPQVLAFIDEAEDRFARLRRDADALLAKYPEPSTRPPLFGIPIGVKDIFHADGFTTYGGTQVPASAIQGEEATSVRQMKEAGALVLGKTVTTEFAYFAPGPTRNPHDPTRTPGGSSSGSAAAVGAGLCPFAFGTQTIGSINRPGAYCGAVGYKPSYERISRVGVIPLSPSVDHIGFFTADVAGAELAASVLAADWQAASQLTQPVFGIPEGLYLERAAAKGLEHFRAACQKIADAGFEVKSVAAMADFDNIYQRHNAIVAADAASVHADWFTMHKDAYHWKTADLIQRGQQVSAEELAAALNGRFALRQQLEQLADDHAIDEIGRASV